MARTKEFDENEVLDRALELFRARGFKHTSFSDLVGELGVSRQSLYDTYGDKQALYHTALRRYLDRGRDAIRRQLEAGETIRASFAGLFTHLLASNCDRHHSGCLMVNSMVELAPHDAETRAVAQAYAREIEGVFASQLSAAQRRGELGADKDPVALARFFFHTILGLSVAARALGDREALKQSAAVALRALD